MQQDDNKKFFIFDYVYSANFAIGKGKSKCYLRMKIRLTKKGVNNPKKGRRHRRLNVKFAAN
jgi:hypothetical protein